MRQFRGIVLVTTAVLVLGTFVGCTSNNKDTTKQLQETNQKVDALSKVIVVNPDGSARFATATPIPIIEYKDFGFGLSVPSTVKMVAAGTSGKDATKENGSVLAASGGTSLFLVWNHVDPPLTPQESVVGSFNLLQSLTGSKLEALGAGQGLTVDSQSGAYGTFVTRDTGGTVDGVGIVGGWVCPSDKRSYALTVTGKQLEPVQQSFVYLTNGFKCESGKSQPAASAKTQ